jgi:hypothetical protein
MGRLFLLLSGSAIPWFTHVEEFSAGNILSPERQIPGDPEWRDQSAAEGVPTRAIQFRGTHGPGAQRSP